MRAAAPAWRRSKNVLRPPSSRRRPLSSELPSTLPIDASATAAPRPRPRVPLPGATVAALVVAAVACIVAWRELPDVGVTPKASSLRGAEAMLFEPTGNSPPLVFAATLWLLWRRWPRLRASFGIAPLRVPAALLLSVAGGLCFWSHYTGTPALLLPALTCALLGGGFWLGGRPGARAVLLPAVFVMTAFPIPAVLLNQFIYPLQIFTAETVTAILNAVGLATRVEGDLIFRDGAIFQVIESCSGVRTVETIVMSSLLYHDLFYRSRLQSWLLFLLAPFVGIAANLLRVIGIVLNPYSKFAAIHTLQGLVMIVVAVMMLAALDLLLTRLLPADAPGTRVRSTRPLAPARAALLAALAGGLAIATLAVSPWTFPVGPETPLSAFPVQLAGVPGEAQKLDREFYGTTTFSEWVHRRHAQPDGPWVDVLLGSDRRLDPFVSPLSRKAAVPSPGTILEASAPIELASGRRAERFVMHSRRGREIVYLWQIGTRGPAREVGRALLSLDRGPWRRPGRALVVRLTTPADEHADERLRAFAAATEAALADAFGDEFVESR